MGPARHAIRRAAPALALAAALAAPAALLAQATPAAVPAAPDSVPGAVTLAGTVRDSAGRPLRGAEVHAGRQIVLSDLDGTFEIADVSPDTVDLFVRRIGYRPAEVTIAVDSGVRVELAVKLVPNTYELGTITIEGRSLARPLWRAGYYEREKLGMGTFFGPEYMERFGGTIAALMTEVPSVRVTRDLYERVTVLGRSADGACPLNVFVDGVYSRWAADVGFEQLLARNEILAVEVYPRSTNMPSIFQGYTGGVLGNGGMPSPRGEADDPRLGGAKPALMDPDVEVDDGPPPRTVDCGAIAIWTKPAGE